MNIKKYIGMFSSNGKIGILLLLIFLFGTGSVFAQSKVTFKVNLKPLLKDSTVVPKRDDIYLKGNVFPLSSTKKVYMEDTAPVDSIYQVTVDFPYSAMGKQLDYNFFIYNPDKDKLIKEHRSRQLKLQKGDRELKAIYFDSYVW